MDVGQVQQKLKDLEDDEVIPAISAILIVLVLFTSDFSYYYIDLGMTLLFYAVLVRIWTEMGASSSMSSHRDLAYLNFLLMSVGAVAGGFMIRQGAQYLTGELLAAQSLALSVVISRFYINLQDKKLSSLGDIIRYKGPVDQYLILVPSTISFGLPALVYQTGSYGYYRTTSQFIALVVFSLFVGAVLYYIEQK